MQFRTQGFAGYSVEFSPFEPGLLAVAASQNFGIIGNGKLFVLRSSGRGLEVQSAFDTRDALFDCSWSEENERILLSGGGDGSLRLWDVGMGEGRPVQSYEGAHEKDILSVDWNLVGKDTFLSAAWDKRINLWSPRRAQPLTVFEEHLGSVYSAIWSPSHPRLFASASGDRTLKIWDTNEPFSVQTVLAHDHEVLSCDWSKYDENLVATGSVDKTVKVWDIRQPRQELKRMSGHMLAVRRVKFSPHHPSVVVSCSYDMSVIVWDIMARHDPFVRKFDHHTEFVVGLDLSLFNEGEIATCAWDETVDILSLEAPSPLHARPQTVGAPPPLGYRAGPPAVPPP